MRKLTITEKNAITTLSKKGVPTRTITEAFNISRTAVYYHSNNSTRDAQLSYKSGRYWSNKFPTMSYREIGNVIRNKK